MSVKILFDYLSSRAEYEDITIYDLNFEYFEQLFSNGQREFYGVHLDDNGFPLWDENEPFKGALNRHLSHKFKSDENLKDDLKDNTSKYLLTEKDYKYFMDLYGINGAQKNMNLIKISFEEFRWAGFFFQLKSLKIWTHFTLKECQMVRDQLLVMLRKEPIGFVQIAEYRFRGIEHLKPH